MTKNKQLTNNPVQELSMYFNLICIANILHNLHEFNRLHRWIDMTNGDAVYSVEYWCNRRFHLELNTYLRFVQQIWIKVRSWWQIQTQHQSTYLGGPESVLMEIPPFRPHSKLYIPSTLNIAFIQWHTHLNVCAVK